MQLESANAVLASIVAQARQQRFSLEGLLDAISMNSDQEIWMVPANIKRYLFNSAPPSYSTAMMFESVLEIHPAFSRHYAQPDQNGQGEQLSYQK